jgi:hypothetical protein
MWRRLALSVPLGGLAWNDPHHLRGACPLGLASVFSDKQE